MQNAALRSKVFRFASFPLIDPAMRRMHSVANRPGARRGVTRRVDGRPFIAVVLLAGLLGFYAYQHWTAKPEAPLIGRARVVDGDSIEISGARIRLQGIDAPERSQTCVDAKGQTWSCGQAAAQELRSYISNRIVTCAPKGRDRYDRVLAVCSVPDGSDVNAWIVRHGWAVTSSGVQNYRAEQNEAQAAKRGIWAGAFLPPREWRRRHPE
jgi:endonuclease YncB( thermonuclease family)